MLSYTISKLIKKKISIHSFRKLNITKRKKKSNQNKVSKMICA